MFSKMFSMLTRRFDEQNIPFAAIGAMALSAYGLPRFTADIDLLSESAHRNKIYNILTEAGFTCFQETETFAQFDSEMGVYGKVDLMFVGTPAGKAMLKRRIRVSDDLLGEYPVIQPSDYIVLKLMATANDPSRLARDEADIAVLLSHIRPKNLSVLFEPIQRDRILEFARQFRLEKQMKRLFKKYLDSVLDKKFYVL
ncbi:MAG: nucleotidyl transferase AbiEii/AbiGii toxin family protein [Thermodesulfobacteriota bacterium]